MRQAAHSEGRTHAAHCGADGIVVIIIVVIVVIIAIVIIIVIVVVVVIGIETCGCVER